MLGQGAQWRVRGGAGGAIRTRGGDEQLSGGQRRRGCCTAELRAHQQHHRTETDECAREQAGGGRPHLPSSRGHGTRAQRYGPDRSSCWATWVNGSPHRHVCTDVGRVRPKQRLWRAKFAVATEVHADGGGMAAHPTILVIAYGGPSRDSSCATSSGRSDNRRRVAKGLRKRWLRPRASRCRSRNHQYPAVNGQAVGPTRTVGE